MKMKSFKTIIALVICIGFLFSATSCVVFTPKHNGSPQGYHKNSNNPHHPMSTNPGNAHGNNKK